MKFGDYEKTYGSTYAEFADLVLFLLKDAIAETEGILRHQSTKALERGLQVSRSNWKNGSCLRQSTLKAKLKTSLASG